MIRLTLADAQPEVSRVAGATGMNTSDPRVLAYLNLAQQELMNAGDWPSLICRMRFKVNGGKITVPSEFDRILYMNVDGVSIAMQSPWFEFVANGPDLLYAGWNTPPIDYADGQLLGQLWGAIDKEQVVTFEDIPTSNGPYYPIVVGTVNELVAGTRPVIVLQGYDQNNQWIRSPGSSGGWIDGVEIAINGDTPPFTATTTQAFSAITAVIKPATNGYVPVYVSSLAAPTPFFLVTYAPNDINPYYRRYCIRGLSKTQFNCVLARLRRRYVPALQPNDFLLISNLPALITMTQAIYYREAKDIQSYIAYREIAIKLLQDEASAYIGKQRQKPLITMGEGMGVRLDGNYIL